MAKSKKLSIALLTILLLSIVLAAVPVSAYVMWSTNSFWQTQCSEATRATAPKNYTETFMWLYQLNENPVGSSDALYFNKKFTVYNLTGTDDVQVFCTKNGEIMPLPDPSNYGADETGLPSANGTMLAHTIHINASNYQGLYHEPGQPSLQYDYYMVGELRYHADNPSGAEFGDIITCIYNINWDNETSYYAPDQGCTDKIAVSTAQYPRINGVQQSESDFYSRSNSFFSMAGTVLGYLVGFAGLVWQLIIVLYWIFLILLVLFAIGLFLSLAFYAYNLVNNAINKHDDKRRNGEG